MMQMPESIGAVGGESVSTALTRLQITHHRPSGTEAKWARLDLLYRKQTAAKVYAAGGGRVRASQLCCSGLHSEVGDGLSNEGHSAASKRRQRL